MLPPRPPLFGRPRHGLLHHHRNRVTAERPCTVSARDGLELGGGHGRGGAKLLPQFHIPLWILTGNVLVFLAAAYQPLDGMPTRVRREVTPPIPNTRVTISIHASYQAQSLLARSVWYKQPNTTPCTSSDRLWLAWAWPLGLVALGRIPNRPILAILAICSLPHTQSVPSAGC